jgi:hypothetical protein
MQIPAGPEEAAQSCEVMRFSPAPYAARLSTSLPNRKSRSEADTEVSFDFPRMSKLQPWQ